MKRTKQPAALQGIGLTLTVTFTDTLGVLGLPVQQKKKKRDGHANTLLSLLCTLPPLRQLKTNVAYERRWQKIIRKPCPLKRIRWMIWSGYGSIKKSDWQWRGNKGCDDRFFMSRWVLKVIHSLIPKTMSTVGQPALEHYVGPWHRLSLNKRKEIERCCVSKGRGH